MGKAVTLKVLLDYRTCRILDACVFGVDKLMIPIRHLELQFIGFLDIRL